MKGNLVLPLGLVLLGVAAAAPAYAQEADAAPPPDASESAPADAMPATDEQGAADATATEDSAPAGDAAAAGDETAAGDSGSEETASSGDEGSAGESREPRYVYAGADYAFLRTSLSKDKLKTALGGDDFDSDFYRVRVGTRLFPQIGVEAQLGVKNEDGSSSGKVETNQMYGLYLVPTGNLFRFLEVSAPVGYSHLKLENGNGSVNFDSVSFGLNIEVPVYVNPDSPFPDVRIGGGGTVFYAEREARTYGYHAGVRLDFKL